MATQSREQPAPVCDFFGKKSWWLFPVLLIEWPLEWLAYGLGRWSLIEVLNYLGKFTVLIAVIFYFKDSGNRLKQKHYQAWQVINTAQHTGGSGGRIEALSELNKDGVPLVGVDVSSGFLQGVQLPKAHLLRANFENADARNGNFSEADLSYASLTGANFRQGNFEHADLDSANLSDADLCGANLRGADLSGAVLDGADLGNADLGGIRWQNIKSLKKSNLAGVKDAPAGFLEWARKQGAVQLDSSPGCPVSTAP